MKRFHELNEYRVVLDDDTVAVNTSDLCQHLGGYSSMSFDSSSEYTILKYDEISREIYVLDQLNQSDGVYVPEQISIRDFIVWALERLDGDVAISW